MPRTRFTIRLLTFAAALAIAAPAALAPLDAGGAPVEVRIGEADASDHLEATGESRRPVLPVVGRPDYGGAEAAFGAARSGHAHAGQDMFAPAGTPLVAVTDATVADAGTDGGQGHYVHLYDGRRERTYVYMHMIEPAPVKPGERVAAGEAVGGVGCTGSCWGDHLHFEIRDGKGIGGSPIDPLPHLRDWETLAHPR